MCERQKKDTVKNTWFLENKILNNLYMLGNNITFGQNNYKINNTAWPLLQEILF